MGLLDSIVSGGMNLIGGLLNQGQQSNTNFVNTVTQEGNLQGTYLPDLVANARKAGLSPLAVLGQTSASGGTAVAGTGVGDALGKMGSDISRAALATADKDDQASLLSKQLTMAQIDKTYAEAAAAHAQAASTFGQPGTPPGGGDPDGSSPSRARRAYGWWIGADGKPFLGTDPQFGSTQYGPLAWPGAADVARTSFDQGYKQFAKGVYDNVTDPFLRYARRFVSQSSDGIDFSKGQ